MGVKRLYFLQKEQQEDVFTILQKWVQKLPASKNVGSWLNTRIILHYPDKNSGIPAERGNEMYVVRLEASKDIENQIDYFILRNQVVAADTSFYEIIKKTEKYNPRQHATIVGEVYDIGVDFRIKIGTVKIGTDNKGYIIEVEYKPSSNDSDCEELFKEFMGSLEREKKTFIKTMSTDKIRFTPSDVDYKLYNLDEQMCTGRHVALQYVVLLQQVNLL